MSKGKNGAGGTTAAQKYMNSAQQLTFDLKTNESNATLWDKELGPRAQLNFNLTWSEIYHEPPVETEAQTYARVTQDAQEIPLIPTDVLIIPNERLQEINQLAAGLRQRATDIAKREV